MNGLTIACLAGYMSCTIAATESALQPLHILVADDQSGVLEALRLLFKCEGYSTTTATSPAAVFKEASAQRFDLILMDLNYARDTTSGKEGLDLLQRLRASGSEVPVIVMTAWGNIELAVEAMRRGASDFIQKPWNNDHLLDTIRTQSRRRRQNDMDLARHVQSKLFPRFAPSLATLESCARCLPAREVSGDYYDFLSLPGSRAAYIIGDVSGKGMAAALLMANLQGSFRSQPTSAHDRPIDLMAELNRLFYESTPPEQYTTTFYAQYEESNRRLTYVNCGHPAAILLRNDQSVERLAPTATVLGLFRSWTAEQGTVSLDPGDTLLLFSDGVIEAGLDGGGDHEYGDQRLLETFRAVRRFPLDQALDRVIESVQAYTSGPPTDDMTVLALRALYNRN